MSNVKNEIASLLSTFGEMSFKSICADCDANEDQIKMALDEMENQGYVESDDIDDPSYILTDEGKRAYIGD